MPLEKTLKKALTYPAPMAIMTVLFNKISFYQAGVALALATLCPDFVMLADTSWHDRLHSSGVQM